MKEGLGLLAIAGIIGLIGWYQYAVWSECLSTNSFFYCVAVLGK